MGQGCSCKKISGETLVTLVNDQNFFRKLYGRFWKKFPEVGNVSKTLSGTGHSREVAERVPPSAALKAERCYNSVTGTPVRFQNRCRNGVPARSASTTALEWGGW